ncbi:MAG: enoyl-CoA hydratase/isomerase family protein [SAR324 cluster bacterium]|nr:enoyl-CoA hydratase/isomerase family protein [SAR324 cluster bacterium]MCZ6748298.1 enoyl-CoA hydratase/isomerase family protein [SAR324 cluster bacterium]
MEWETVKLEGEGAIRHLVLDRPQVHNAVNRQLLADVLAACAAIEALEDCRCVIMRGEGPSFCSGADLKESVSQGGTVADGLRRARLGERAVDALGELTPVTIAAVHGHAIGGGACFAMACDFRIGAESAKVSIREVSLGLSLSWHSIPNTVHLVGPSRAKEMIMFAETYGAERLLEYGFYNQVVPDGELGEAAQALAEKVLRQPPIPTAMTKLSVNAYVRALDRAVFHLDAPGVTLTGRTRDSGTAKEAFFSGGAVQWENE